MRIVSTRTVQFHSRVSNWSLRSDLNSSTINFHQVQTQSTVAGATVLYSLISTRGSTPGPVCGCAEPGGAALSGRKKAFHLFSGTRFALLSDIPTSRQRNGRWSAASSYPAQRPRRLLPCAVRSRCDPVLGSPASVLTWVATANGRSAYQGLGTPQAPCGSRCQTLCV